MYSQLKMKIKAEEWYGVVLSFIYFFCVLASYYVIRPMRDQLAAEVGSAKLPWFFASTLVATLILTPLFAWIVSIWPRRVIMPIVYLFFVLCQFMFIPLFKNEFLVSPQYLGALFFVWVSVFNLFAVSVFWSFMTDIWSDRQARRLFPIIALGGTAGAVIGPFITRSIVDLYGQTSLLLVSAGLLIGAIFCVLKLGEWAHTFGADNDEVGREGPIGGGMFDGLKQIFSSPFVGIMALLMLMNDAIGTIAYVLVTDYSGTAFPNDAIARTRFAATMDLSANVLQIIVQLTITRFLLVRYGAGFIFLICAAVIVFAGLLMAFVDNPTTPVIGTLPVVAIVLILTRSLTYSMIQPARETLYTLVPRNIRYKGKNAVDTVVWRAGDVFSVLSVNVFRSLGVKVAGFGIIWAVLAAASGLIGWRLANKVERGDFK